jgi:hypothetical protein
LVNFNAIEKELNNFIKDFKSNVINSLNDWYKNNKNNIFKNASNFICERIVGLY